MGRGTIPTDPPLCPGACYEPPIFKPSSQPAKALSLPAVDPALSQALSPVGQRARCGLAP
jgi:hypothetical protein